jgi:hypothetical protein
MVNRLKLNETVREAENLGGITRSSTRTCAGSITIYPRATGLTSITAGRQAADDHRALAGMEHHCRAGTAKELRRDIDEGIDLFRGKRRARPRGSTT